MRSRRLPLLFTALFGPLALVGVGRAAPPQEPPSSLEPPVKRTVVTFSHLHRRTTQCYPFEDKGKKVVCRAKRKDASAATSVRLVPVPSARDKVMRNDPRQPVVVEFPDEAGLRKVQVELLEGHWDLEWHDQRARFVVAPEAPFTVALRTVAGACGEPPGCPLRGADVDRSVTVPAPHRAAP